MSKDCYVGANMKFWTYCQIKDMGNSGMGKAPAEISIFKAVLDFGKRFSDLEISKWRRN